MQWEHRRGLLSPCRVNVNPVVVMCCISKDIDLLLGDGDVVAETKVMAFHCLEFFESYCRCHFGSLVLSELLESINSGDGATDHECVDLVGPLIAINSFSICMESGHIVVEQNSIAANYFSG